jgi:8-oxo-dGTP diphosphatase
MIDASLEMPLLVTAAVISDDDKILITRRPKDKRHPGLWEFPGGKVDPGESPEEALCREIREELDAEVQVMEIFEVVFHRYDWGPVLILAYSCRLITKSIHNIGVSEHRWIHPRELHEFPILPADQPIIDRLVNQSA